MKRVVLVILAVLCIIGVHNTRAQDERNRPQVAEPGLVEVKIDASVRNAVAAAKATRTRAEQKLATSALEVLAQYKANGNSFQKAKPEQMPQSPLGIVPVTMVKVDRSDRVYVYIRIAKGHRIAEVLPLVRKNKGTADYSNDKFHLIQAWIPASKLTSIAASAAVGSIELVVPPLHNTGPVNSEGDSRLHADVARSVMTASGAGIKVGVMSDDCGSTENLVAPRIANGELGATTTVLDDSKGGTRTHEGLAMMEIVQDVAPSAQIYFATASTGEGNFAKNIQNLANAGCRVITDDVIYFDEPVFEDGIVAQAVDAVATVNNVVYTSSSTNVGNSSYFGTYNPLANQPVGNSGNKNVHNFSGGTYINTFTWPSGRTLFFTLHWDDQYGASDNDYDLYLVDPANTTTFLSSTTTQNGSQNPFESFSATNSGATANYALVIVRNGVSGTDPNGNARLKLTIFQGIPMTYGSAASSTWGHACAVNALGCGAIGADRTSAIGGENNYNTLEAFSAQGPVYMVQFGAGLVGGNRPLLSTRTKPDVSSFDGVTTSVPGFAPFYGTSASAPHVAGVAALLLGMFPSMSHSSARAAIRNGCVDYGAAGMDNAFGAGRTDAFRTIALENASSNPSTYLAAFSTPSAAIPDNNSGGVTSTVTISPSCTNITPDSVFVLVTVDGHPKIGDLVYSLNGPDNQTVTLMNRPTSGGGTATGKNPNVVFGDVASSSIQTTNASGAEQVGFYIPANVLSSTSGFRGHTLSGTWTLTVSDNAAGNTGALKDWGLYLKEGQPLPPNMTLAWSPLFLFPNDHTLRNITVTNSASGGCSPTLTLQSIVSNEADASADPGDVAGDIQGATLGTNDLAFQLRSEALSTGNGRYYTVTYRISDVGGYQRDTMFAIPAFSTPGRIDPSATVAASVGSVTMDVAPSPNPLTTSSTISYTITGPSSAPVLLTIVNNRGKWVRNLDYGTRSPGTYALTFDGNGADGSPLPNGVYAYQLTAGAPYNSLNSGIVIVNKP
ncbi:MAG: S8 family serine peptidase [Bacteroidetes bacterium]|nr:S8 family serine peptidase [Bacteroidota bacterium]